MSTRKSERTQRERSEGTTRALIDAARARFAAHGYALTSVDGIAQDAGVSKGALYHHFPAGKADLFRAVYEQAERQLAVKTSAAFMREKDPWKGLYAGFRAFFDEIFDPGIQRIMLTESPAVLGWETVRAIQERYAIAQIKEALRRAIAEGIIASRNVEPLAAMLFAAVCEAASMTARAPDPRAAGRSALTELRNLLDGMRIDSGARKKPGTRAVAR